MLDALVTYYNVNLVQMSVSVTYDGLEKGWCRGYNVVWSLVRDLFSKYAWMEFYPRQKAIWLSAMESCNAHNQRVWVHPFEGVAELQYDRYLGDSHNLVSCADFVVIANFDDFIKEFLFIANRRTVHSYSQ